MHIIMNERDAGKKHMIMTILNSMSTSERKEVLNNIYGMYADTDSIKFYNHYDELLYKIREVDNATEKTFRKTFNEIGSVKHEIEQIHDDIEAFVHEFDESIQIDSARIDAQAETIQKLCKVIKFILPYINVNPLSKKYDETINKLFEDIYKEF